MSLLNTLREEMKVAMKARDQKRLSALRQMVSVILYAQVDNPDLGDEQIVAVLIKEAKKRREAIEAYQAAGRVESAEQEQYELKLIEGYLPAMMSEDEVRAVVQRVLDKEQGISNIGLAMRAVMSEVKGQADGGLVSKIVKEMFHPVN